MNQVRKSTGAGFTLIELLVVISLLGILSGIAVFAVGNARDKAVVEACRSQQAQFLKAMDLYYVDKNGIWPGGANAASTTAETYAYSTLNTALVPEFLKELPPYQDAGGTKYPDADRDFYLQVSRVPASGTIPAYIQVRTTDTKVAQKCLAMPATVSR